MQISEEGSGNVVIVAVTGRIDSTTSAALDDHLTRVGQAGRHRVVVDLAGVDFISSAGLRVMLTLAKRTKQNAGALVLSGLTDPVRQVFTLAGFLPLFAVVASKHEAVRRITEG